MRAGSYIDQLCGYSNGVVKVVSSNTAFEDVGNIKFFADDRRIFVYTLVSKRGCSRRNPQVCYAGKYVQQLFGESICEVLVLFNIAKTLER